MTTKAERIAAFQKERALKVCSLLTETGADIVLIHDPRIRHWIGHPEVKYVLVTTYGIEICEDLVKHLQESNATIGVDSYLTASDFLELKEKLPHIKWISVGNRLSNIMAVKDRLEILMLRKSATIAHGVFQEIEKNLIPGCMELDLLYIAYKTMAALGGNGFSFEPSIGSGPRSTLIFAGIETRQLQNHDPLVIDLGVSFRGYQSDMTYSYLIGNPDNKEWKKAYAALEKTMNIVVDHLRPGAVSGTLHEICENAFKRLGYAGQMPHYLGHGIGLYIHEPPFLAPGSRDILQEGMVVAVEPSIVLADAGMGIRREMEFLITSDGCEAL